MTLLLTDNSTLTKFIDGVTIGNKKTAFDYRRRLESFRVFVLEKYKISLDELILTLTTVPTKHGPKIDVYDLLSEYVGYIYREKNVSPLTLRLLLSTVKCYLETSGKEIKFTSISQMGLKKFTFF